MASMSGWLLVFGLFILALTGGVYFGFLNQYVDPLKRGVGGLFAVILATVAVVGIFFVVLGLLYRQWE